VRRVTIEPGMSALVKASERDRESPCLWSGIGSRAGNIRAREGFGKRPGISASLERYLESRITRSLCSQSGMSVLVDKQSGSGPDLFPAGRFILAGTAAFGGTGCARCGRGCPYLAPLY